MSNEKEPSKPVKEKSDDEKYLFERVTTRAEVTTETELEATVESSTEELDDYYTAMGTGPTEDDIYESMEVKLKWSRVLIVGFVIGLIICGITILIVWIISSNGREYLWLYLPWILFIIFMGTVYTRVVMILAT